MTEQGGDNAGESEAQPPAALALLSRGEVEPADADDSGGDDGLITCTVDDDALITFAVDRDPAELTDLTEADADAPRIAAFLVSAAAAPAAGDAATSPAGAELNVSAADLPVFQEIAPPPPAVELAPPPAAGEAGDADAADVLELAAAAAPDPGPAFDVESPPMDLRSCRVPADPWKSLAAEESDLSAAPPEPDDAPSGPTAAPQAGAADDSGEPEGVDEDTAAALSIGHDQESVAAGRGSSWTIPLLCAGIALLACCVLIPQADINRRMAWEREKLKRDLASIRQQVEVNEKFLEKVTDDPNLAERLAQRQLRVIRRGAKVLELDGDDDRRGGERSGADAMSPFHIVSVAPPPPMPPYQPRGGRLAEMCYNPRTRLYLMGGGLGLLAVGLVLGYVPRR